MTVTGYSGTPLAQKLGIKAGTKVFLAGAPKNYKKLVSPWPEGARVTPRLSSETDIVHVFATARSLPMGLVDIKVCAIDTTWSGLKLVIRRERRNGKPE